MSCETAGKLRYRQASGFTFHPMHTGALEHGVHRILTPGDAE
jgi:hypothetical protein